MNFNLKLSDWVSILKGAAVAGAGVALTYVVQHVSAADFGVYGPVVVGVLSVVVNYVRKVVMPGDETPKEEDKPVVQ
jgi:hypothetical protein